jgi:hypothetical protein
MASDAVSVATSVIGRNFMNSPTTPGQNRSGMNAASVVAVEAVIGQLGHHDRAVDQHPDRENQGEQHDDVDGQTEQAEHQDAGQKRARHGEADQTGRAQPQRRDHHDHDQQNRAQHVVLQVAQHGRDVVRLVLDVADRKRLWPLLPLGLDHAAHLGDGVDDVGADPLRHLERQRRLAVDPGEALRILEGAPHARDVAQPHHRVARRLDREIEHVLGGLEHSRHLDREPALAGVERTRGDQTVVARDQGEQVVELKAVALHQQGIDHDLEQLFPLAGDVDLEHARQRLEASAQLTRMRQQRPLRHLAREGDHEHREQREVDLADDRLVGAVGQLGLGLIDLLAHVLERLVDVDPGIELQRHGAGALIGVRAHLLDALDAAQLLLHRPDQKALGVLGRDSLMGNRHVDDRHLDVGIRLLGDGAVDLEAADQDQEQDQQDGARAGEARVDQPVHARSCAIRGPAGTAAPSGTARTRSPARTKPWPTVIRRTCSGSPASHTASAAARTTSAG